MAQLILLVFNSNQLKYERVNDQESFPLLLFLHLVYLSTLLPCTVPYIPRFLTGHILEFDFGGWYEGEFIKMLIDEDGDELCHLKDTTTGDIHKVQLRAEENGEWIECSDWYPLFDCFECEVGTRGDIVCEVCGVCKDGADDFSSDDLNSSTPITVLVLPLHCPA